MLFTWEDFKIQELQACDAARRMNDYLDREEFERGHVDYAIKQIDVGMSALGVMRVQLLEKKSDARTKRLLFQG